MDICLVHSHLYSLFLVLFEAGEIFWSTKQLWFFIHCRWVHKYAVCRSHKAKEISV